MALRKFLAQDSVDKRIFGDKESTFSSLDNCEMMRRDKIFVQGIIVPRAAVVFDLLEM